MWKTLQEKRKEDSQKNIAPFHISSQRIEEKRDEKKEEPRQTTTQRRPAVTTQKNSFSYAENPENLHFSMHSVSAVLGNDKKANAALLKKHPYLKSEPAYKSTRKTFKGTWFGESLELQRYNTIGGGICAIAAIFTALPEADNQAASQYIDYMDGIERNNAHPLIQFFNKLYPQLQKNHEDAALDKTTVAMGLPSITPLQSNDESVEIDGKMVDMKTPGNIYIQDLETAINTLEHTKASRSYTPPKYKIYVWLLEKNGIVLNTPTPLRQEPHEKSIHLLFSTELKEGEEKTLHADTNQNLQGHYSLLVPTNDNALKKRAEIHEKFVENGEKVAKEAQSRTARERGSRATSISSTSTTASSSSGNRGGRSTQGSSQNNPSRSRIIKEDFTPRIDREYLKKTLGLSDKEIDEQIQAITRFKK